MSIRISIRTNRVSTSKDSCYYIRIRISPNDFRFFEARLPLPRPPPRLQPLQPPHSRHSRYGRCSRCSRYSRHCHYSRHCRTAAIQPLLPPRPSQPLLATAVTLRRRC